MDFEFTEEHALLRESLRRLITREYPFERRQGIAAAGGFSAAVWRLLARQGVLALGLPESVGGWGGPMEIMVVMEELGRGLVLEPVMSTVLLGGGLIRDHGTVAQRAGLLPAIAAGDCRIAVAHQERQASYVLDRVGTVARRQKGKYVLTGRKTLVPDAQLADLLVLSARDDAAGGVSLFLINPDIPGLRLSGCRTLDGHAAADVTLESVKVATSARLGCPGFALTALERSMDCALAAACAEAVGAMEAINQICLQRLDGRGQSGQRMADMFITATQAQSMSYLATRACRESARPKRRQMLTAARAFVGKAAHCVAREAMRLRAGMSTPARLQISAYVHCLTRVGTSLSQAEHDFGVLTNLLRARAS